MTIDQLIARTTRDLNEKIAARAAIPAWGTVETVQRRCLAENRAPTDAEAGRVSNANAKLAVINAEISDLRSSLDELEQARDQDATDVRLSRTITPTGVGATAERTYYGGSATVLSQPRTYGRNGASERSFFADAFNATVKNSSEAGEWYERGQREAIDHLKQQRSFTSTALAGMVIPQYLVEDAQLALRSGRPFANSCNKKQIPDQGMTFQLPKMTTGGSVAAQATENSTVSNTDEVWANVTLPVVTAAGTAILSRQALERSTPGYDGLIAADLAGAYAAQVETNIINGTGSSGQPLGVLQTSGINAATAFGAAPTAVSFGSKLAGQIAAVTTTGSGIAARMILMHPRRWGWLSTLVDTTNRPLVEPIGASPYNAAGINLAPGASGGDPGPITGMTIVGAIQGVPIITSPAVPINVGTESEDIVVVYDNRQCLLYEDGDDGMPTFLTFEQTAATSLTVTCVSYGYYAFTAGRVPGAIGKVGGLDTGGATFGLVAPTF
jgi:HK97 family phage major capsid protein